MAIIIVYMYLCSMTGVMSQALIMACCLHRNEVARYLMRHTAADPRRSGRSFKPPRPVNALVASFREGNVLMCRELMHRVTIHAIKSHTDCASNTLLHLAIWRHMITSRSAGIKALRDACREGNVRKSIV